MDVVSVIISAGSHSSISFCLRSYCVKRDNFDTPHFNFKINGQSNQQVYVLVKKQPALPSSQVKRNTKESQFTAPNSEPISTHDSLLSLSPSLMSQSDVSWWIDCRQPSSV